MNFGNAPDCCVKKDTDPEAQFEKDMKTCIASGKGRVSNTPEEAAEFAGIPYEKFKATVNAYTAFASRGITMS